MALRLGRAGLDMEGPFPKGTVITSVANSATDGSANVIMSNNAERTTTFTITAATDTIGVFHTVRDDTTGDVIALNGVDTNKGSSGLSQNKNNFQAVSAGNHLAEGFAELGANYFQRFTSTSLTPVNASIVPSMITKANVSSTEYQDIIEMNSEKGYYRFPDTVLIGDKSSFQSRNNDTDTTPGFGLNVQWSGLGDTDKYGSTAQPAMTFQSYSDNALLGTSGFEDKAGPRIMLSSFKGNKNDPWTNIYPRAGQELGKFSWWSHSGETQNGSTTVPPAAITAIANNDWDTDANISLDVIHYAQGRTANDQLAFLKHADGDTIVGAHSSKKIKLGTAGAIGSDVRANSDLTAELLTVDTTETELYNRLQLYSRTTAEINALSSPQAGQVLYNSTLNQVCVYNGTEWRKITDSTM